MKYLVCLTFIYLLYPSKIHSQNPKDNNGNGKGLSEKMKIGHLYGKVIDSASTKSIEYAAVQLFGSVFDSVKKEMRQDVVIAGQLTQENGEFRLEKINVTGKYLLKISALGFQPKEIPVTFNMDREKMKGSDSRQNMGAVYKDLGNIKLRSSVTRLNEVTIQSSAPVFDFKLDKKVFNVNKDLSASGGTAEDVLKKVPSVNVDMEGNVTVRSASPEIFVDGAPTTLSIDQIPAEAIQTIEVITNPSAKYDASGGQGGILNIVLKKNRRVGYNGSMRYGIDEYGKMNGGGDISVREGKLNAFINGNINQRYSISEGETFRENLTGFPLTKISQTQKSISNGLFQHSRGGIDWFMNNRNTLTFSGNIVNGEFRPVDTLKTNTDTLLSTGIRSTSYKRVSATGRKFRNRGGTFQFKHLFPREDEELTADINYNKISYNAWADYDTRYFDSQLIQSENPVMQQMISDGSTGLLTAQTDYVRPLNSTSKIETGVRITDRTFETHAENKLKNNATQQFEIIKNQSFQYTFNDRIFAGYLIYGKQVSRFSYQFGLRGESSFYTGELVDSGKKFINTFPVSLFPSMGATFAMNEKNSFQFSFSRRINRPTFFQLIPFIDYSDSLNLRKGNPGLVPEFTNSYELSLQRIINPKNNVLLTGYFKTSTDIITSYQTYEFDSVINKKIILRTYKNADASYIYGGELTSKHNLVKWLEFTLNGNAFYSVIMAENIQNNLNNRQFSWNAKGNFTFSILKNLSLQVTPEYISQTALPKGGRGSGGGEGGSKQASGPTGGMGRQGWWEGNITTAQGFTKARWNVESSIRFEFLKNKNASVTLSVRDIFGTDKNETFSETEFFRQSTYSLRDPQIFKLNFIYRFGKFDASLFKRKDTKGGSEGMDMGM